MTGLKTFRRDCSGNVAIMFGLALVPMTLAAGVGIDMVQTNRSLTILQAATDAAAIAGATSGKTTVAEIRPIVEDYLKANGAEWALSDITDIDPQINAASRTFSLRVSGKRNTSIMHLAGVDSTELGAFAEVKMGGDGLEVAMVLDNTGSMAEAGRMPALKSAANDFVENLMDIEATGAYVRVGIVPFAQYVNVGLSRRGESWLNVPNDWTENFTHTPVSYPNFRKYDCVMVPVINDGIDTGQTQESCKYDYGDPVYGEPVNATYDHKWYGCVGSRPEPLDENIGTLSTRYPGLMDTTCVAELVELTDNKSKLTSAINAMVTVGETYIPAGLLWGWNMLDSEKPLNSAKTAEAIKSMGGTKAIVLMSDGANTLASYAPNHWGDNPADGPRGDTKMAALCENIKQDGITIYTVSFMITDVTAKNRMKACASDAAKAFDADSAAALASSFAAIGESLAAMRLSK
jgi:Flp pilus assembly protein TadG